MSDTRTLTFTVGEVDNLLAFLERLVCHEGDKYFPPRFQADYIRTEANRLINKIEEQTDRKLEELVFAKKEAPQADEDCEHIFSARGVCQLCGLPKEE